MHPEIQATLIAMGGGATVLAGKFVFEYLKMLLGKNGKNGRSLHCQEHENMVITLAKLAEFCEEERQIKIHMEAIKRVKEGS